MLRFFRLSACASYDCPSYTVCQTNFQTALITLLAQFECFVPAGSAHIGMVYKIFTCVDASDNISVGESTFMCRDKWISRKTERCKLQAGRNVMPL